MTDMAKNTQDDSKRPASESAADQKRAWVRPALVEYGHLAKLTRGASGAVTETGMLKMCL